MWCRSGLWLALVLVVFFASCASEPPSDTPDPVLAKVYNKTLILSDIDGIVEPNTSPEDSVHLIQSFVDRWVHEAILMHEAEKHVSQDMDLDKLVRDYRSSLVLNNFEQELFKSELDTVITDEDVEQYFNANKEQFRLRYSIVRYYFIKLPVVSQNVDYVKQWWTSKEPALMPDLKQSLKKEHAYFSLHPHQWYALQDLKKKLPKNLRSSLSPSLDDVLKNNNYLYFLKILEMKKKGEFPPISFVREQVEKIILHGRKMKLIEDKKAELYKQEVNSDHVKIFTN
ncbi:MAG TPA: hypothetical protein ENK85_09535 [Saprospiraceae bacterium]|nr:hypothetical protein [Saprospiraceae bacterium]